MILVNANQISKSFGPKTLFEGLSLVVEKGDRIGLIGPNGMGKSTLLKILCGLESPDSGKVIRSGGIRVGYLAQVPEFEAGATLWETVAGEGDPDDWSHETRAREWISRVGLDRFELDMVVDRLSGGWKKRVALARELMQNPDLLLLDEPTNHLDVESILWLERFLEDAPFATVTITHDRAFLRSVANQIVEIDRRHEGGLFRVRGGYEEFVVARDQMISGQERREQILKNTLRRETEWLRQGAKARTTKQQARIKNAGQLKESVEGLSKRNQVRNVDFSFQTAGRNPKKLIEAKNLSQTLGGRVLFQNFSLLITPQSRIGLLGENGSGKSTLIRTLVGEIAPTSGEVVVADGIRIAYFDQNRAHLDPNKTVLETLCPYGSTVDFQGRPVHIRSYLSRFLFEGADADMKVGRLSGGEQARLRVAELMLQSANLLILDEPTNDLDLATLSVLEECLTEYDGAVLLVSHDRYFLEQIAETLIAFPSVDSADKTLIAYADLAQWQASLRVDGPQRKTAEKRDPKSTKVEPVKNQKTRLGFKETRELAQMEEKVLESETHLSRLEEQIGKPEVIADPARLQSLTREMSEAQKKIEALYLRWQELEAIQRGE